MIITIVRLSAKLNRTISKSIQKLRIPKLMFFMHPNYQAFQVQQSLSKDLQPRFHVKVKMSIHFDEIDIERFILGNANPQPSYSWQVKNENVTDINQTNWVKSGQFINRKNLVSVEKSVYFERLDDGKTIKLNEISLEENGLELICVIENELGRAEKSVQLMVTGNSLNSLNFNLWNSGILFVTLRSFCIHLKKIWCILFTLA